ncbi:PREDICTED: beta-1,3-galactosyltransferase 5 isoform X1 [Nicrophorus vespilloides]|uniref:Hexosyltransferase n=1 Tax=Nicrophorus vespilloides TaxID=110193 RepID=A0ABM1ME16_NICVS|nr:PREDICTED: beta-1,3-galactosyltransferase 5 isoform X1 [Nicrophorus vespilloides]
MIVMKWHWIIRKPVKMDRRFIRQNGPVLFITLLFCLSVWQIIVSGPGPPDADEITVPAYTVITPNSTRFRYPVESLNASDYHTLMDNREFSFKMLTIVCNESYPFLLVMVHSAPTNFAKRKTIRETWGQRHDGMKLVFMLGAVDDYKLQKKLELENALHGDFVQGSFKDTYRNVTYKHVMVLKYAVYHCPSAKYILKTDDDVFVNMVVYLDFLNEDLSTHGVTDLLFCNVVKDSEAARSYRSKWRVSFKEYPQRVYPTYCPGWTLLYSPDVVFKLYKEAQIRPYFWIDDVLITGILMKNLNLTHTHNAKYIMRHDDTHAVVYRNSTTLIRQQFLYGHPELNERQIRSLWAFVTRPKIEANRFVRT